MDKIKSIVTGDAAQKPAKTADGAFTTQDSDNAATTQGTSAEGKGGFEGKIDQAADNFATKEGIPQSADKTINSEINKEI